MYLHTYAHMSKTMCAICYVNMYGNIQFPQDFCVIFICVFIKNTQFFFCFVTNLRDAKMTLFPDDFHSVHLTKNKTCAYNSTALHSELTIKNESRYKYLFFFVINALQKT